MSTPIEHITIEPPVWCFACNAITTDAVHRLRDGRLVPLCAACAAEPDVGVERRAADAQPVRELVELARVLAWYAAQYAGEAAAGERHHTARVLLDLTTQTDRAIDRLRRA
jgi:hypothetical protein